MEHKGEETPRRKVLIRTLMIWVEKELYRTSRTAQAPQEREIPQDAIGYSCGENGDEQDEDLGVPNCEWERYMTAKFISHGIEAYARPRTALF